MTYRVVMRIRTAWQAMALHPVGFLASAWPWRSLLYLVSGVLTGAVTLVVFAAAVTAGILTAVALVGIVVLLGAVLMGLPFARLERRRLRLIDLDGIPDPHRPPPGPGIRPWLRARLAEPATWRELILMMVSLTALWWIDVAVLGLAFVAPFQCLSAPFDDPATWPWAVLGVLLLAAAPFSLTAWAGARATLCRIVLAPRDAEVSPDLREISRSRVRLLDAFEAERARLERDLHDGAQQRLVSLSMTLGLMSLDVPVGSPLNRQLESAQEQLSEALADLRHLVRGLNPQVLADNGLVAAIEELAGRFPLPVTVDLQLTGRLPAPVETAAYYAVTETLANVAKHTHATRVALTGRHHADLLVLEVTDDGAGGADPTAGTGLTGLADRLAAVDGRMRVSSPPGGPTLVLMEIPCPCGVTLAEDSALLREGLVSILARFGHDVVDAVADADALTEAVHARRPEFVITDVRMPPGLANDGLRAAVGLRQEFPGLPVLVLNQYVDQSYATQLLDSGHGHAVGYLLKDRVGAVVEFNTAVEQVAAGQTVVDPEVVRQLISRRPDPRQRLTARELEVLALMAQGRSNDTIGKRLYVSDAAVNKHIGNIFSKLDLPTTTDGHRRVLAVLAYLRS